MFGGIGLSFSIFNCVCEGCGFLKACTCGIGSIFTPIYFGVELSPYFLLNVVYNQRLNRNLSLFGKINNILNTQYVSFADYPMPGISVTIGVNMVFFGNTK